MRTMDRPSVSEKKKTHTRTEWNIFISFEQEILKHKIESEFRLHILAISQNYFSAFSHMNLFVRAPFAQHNGQNETIERIRNNK